MQRIMEIIAESLCVEPEEIQPHFSLDDLKIDSLEFMHIRHRIENEFGVKIENRIFKDIQTVEQFCVVALTAIESV